MHYTDTFASIIVLFKTSNMSSSQEDRLYFLRPKKEREKLKPLTAILSGCISCEKIVLKHIRGFLIFDSISISIKAFKLLRVASSFFFFSLWCPTSNLQSVAFKAHQQNSSSLHRILIFKCFYLLLTDVVIVPWSPAASRSLFWPLLHHCFGFTTRLIKSLLSHQHCFQQQEAAVFSTEYQS